jgi:hypothetical protein
VDKPAAIIPFAPRLPRGEGAQLADEGSVAAKAKWLFANFFLKRSRLVLPLIRPAGTFSQQAAGRRDKWRPFWTLRQIPENFDYVRQQFFC